MARIPRPRKDYTYSSNYHSNRKFIMSEILPLMGVSEEEMKEKDESWMKAKMRNLKIKLISSEV